jgi:hypothetical protein
MRRLSFLVAASCAFGLAPLAGRLGAIAGSLAMVVLAIALAIAASGAINALTAGAGATGAFAATLVTSAWTPLAGAALVGLAFAERTTRVRGRRARLAHLGAALAGGAFAGAISSAFVDAQLAVRVVSVVVAAVIVAAPLLVDADDATAHALDAAAALVAEPARTALREGASLRRSAGDVPLDRAATRQVSKTWRSLMRLADARVRLERRLASAPPPPSAVVAMVDGRIVAHVGALARTFTAVDAARAAHVGIDDSALRGVEDVGEGLETRNDAMADLSAQPSPCSASHAAIGAKTRACASLETNMSACASDTSALPTSSSRFEAAPVRR